MSTMTTFTARDGEMLAIRHWEPTGEPRGNLLIIHCLLYTSDAADE